METWLPAPGYEGWYEVSSFGQIRRMRPGRGARLGKILKLYVGDVGYPEVHLYSPTGHRTERVHRLVARAFLGEPLASVWQVNHKDFDKTNNCLENLEWLEPQANSAHAVAAGRANYTAGPNHHSSKLSAADVTEIKRLKGIETTTALGLRFGVHSSHVSRIQNGIWRKNG